MMAYWIESTHHGLAIAPRPRRDDWLEVDLQALRRERVDILVSLLTPPEEAELGLTEEPATCERAGISFRSFPVADRTVPPSISDFAAFLNALYAEMLQGARIAAHCRAGIGRSSLLIASLLCKDGHTAEEAFAMISRARGLQVPDTPEQVVWVDNLRF